MNTITIESALKKMMGSYVTPVAEHKKEVSWHHYKVSDEVMALTFKHRLDIPEDYKNEYYKAINERCQ
jgi:Zn-dependent peptidase ImmA (M78 family)